MVESIEMCIYRLDSAITPSSQRILDFTNDVLERGFGPLSQEASICLISPLSGPCPSVIEPVFFQRLLNFFHNNLLQADEFDLFECTADSLGTTSRNIRRESFNKALRPVMETINNVITNKDCCTLNHLRVVIILLADLNISQRPYFLPFVPASLDLARAAAQSRIDPSDLDMCDDLADVQTAVLRLFNKLYESEGFDNIRQFGESHILPTLVTCAASVSQSEDFGMGFVGSVIDFIKFFNLSKSPLFSPTGPCAGFFNVIQSVRIEVCEESACAKCNEGLALLR
jgi:hypothetical protein